MGAASVRPAQQPALGYRRINEALPVEHFLERICNRLHFGVVILLALAAIDVRR
jgi:hypothetical protein